MRFEAPVVAERPRCRASANVAEAAEASASPCTDPVEARYDWKPPVSETSFDS